MFKKIILISLFLAPHTISAMNNTAMSTLDLRDRAADICYQGGEHKIVLDYTANPENRSGIKLFIQDDIAIQLDPKARQNRLDFWLALAKEQRAAQLAQYLRNEGAQDDRDGSKRKASSGRRGQGVAALGDPEQGAHVQPKKTCVLM